MSVSQNGEALTIGRLSRETGVNVETIRYYERIGLVPRPPRNGGGRRVFNARDGQRLAFIRRCRDLGFTLEDIRALLDLAANGNRTCREVRGKTEHQLASVKGKIIELRRMETALQALVDVCDGGDSPDCPILARLDIL